MVFPYKFHGYTISFQQPRGQVGEARPAQGPAILIPAHLFTNASGRGNHSSLSGRSWEVRDPYIYI